jgi:sec-independent protein translocase protein TatC
MNKIYYYYFEIKNRLLIISFQWLFTTFICYCYKEKLLLFLFYPIYKTYLFNSDLLSFYIDYFIFTNVSDIFNVYFNIVVFFANQITIIFLFYHAIIFLSPGLYFFEYKKLIFLVKVFLLFYVFSFILTNEILLPLSWTFFLYHSKFHDSNKIIKFFFEPKATDYFNYYKNLYYLSLFNFCLIAFGLGFVIYLNDSLIKIKIYRKIFYFSFILFSTVTTPPDVISQIILSLVLMVLYEFLIFYKIFFKKVTN